MNRRARLCAAAACLAFVLAPLSVHALAGEPDLSSVQIELADLPSGFRAVPDSDLVEVGGSAKQVGEALERSLAEASLQQYLVYASDSGDELLELVVVGPLIAPERVGMSREMADSSALADDLMPSFTLYVEQSEPRIIDTAGIGEASVGFTVDSRLTSDLATVTNILGVPWTSATSQFLLALRGEYVVVMMTQHVGSGAAGVDFLAVARHVRAPLAIVVRRPPPTTSATGTYTPTRSTARFATSMRILPRRSVSPRRVCTAPAARSRRPLRTTFPPSATSRPNRPSPSPTLCSPQLP